ncbi:MAG: DUF2254 domain-containing protein [Corynebacteriales bacterium]|nr:DUF2254 domain-containing protein [Mycobacteriales bacterium]
MLAITLASMKVIRLRARAIGERLKSSLLALPMVMLVLAIGLVFLTYWLDTRLPYESWQPELQFSQSAAVSLLSTISGATITTAGVVFSLLVVSLQLASGQFSPRVLRGFYRHRLGQVVIGLLMSTFTYCVLSLPLLDDQGDHAPSVTVMTAMVLGLLSIIAIVAYLDRISRRQYVGSIAERIAAETLDLVHALPAVQEHEISAPDVGDLGVPLVVRSAADGWIQQLSDALLFDSVPPGSVIHVETRPGAFILRGAPLARIWPMPPEPEHTVRQVRDAVVIGSERTMQEDIDFGLRQLNDIALRALSPAVNDPTTAIEVLMRVASIMRPLLLADSPPLVTAHATTTLYAPWKLDHNEYIRHAFDQLRNAAANQLAVSIALVRTLRMLHIVCRNAGRLDVLPDLQRQIDLTIKAGEKAGLLPEDLAELRHASRVTQLG